MHRELTAVFRDYFKRNSRPDGVAPEYGVEVDGVTDDRCSVDVALTFKAGHSYCCGEPSCHFFPKWQRLRSIAATHGIEFASPLTVKLNCVVEAGSHFNVNRSFGLPTENKSASYTQIFSEADAAG